MRAACMLWRNVTLLLLKTEIVSRICSICRAQLAVRICSQARFLQLSCLRGFTAADL